MRNRIFSCLLILCILCSLLPATALATEDGADSGTPVACTQGEGCEADSHDEGCPLYKAPEDTVNGADELTAVEQLAEMIAALPDYADVDETDLSGIYAAKNAYEALSDEEKAAVDADLVAKLEDLAELAAEIEEILKAQAEQGEIEGTVYLADRGETVEVVVAETGTLQALVASTEGYAQENVVSLTISTEPGAFLNYADFTYLRTQLPNLTYLDLTGADCLNDFDPANPVEHEIPRSAMSFNTTLETIVLSEKVTSIAREAFSYCSGLRGDLVIPDNITHLGKAAFGFWGNTYATFDSLTLSKNMEVMEAGAFLRCKINDIVTIPASVTYMGGDGTFGGVFQENCLPGIVFEEGSRLEYIGNICFNGNPNMEGTLTLPDSVTYIGANAFSGCAKLTGELKLPAKLETLGPSSFFGCTGLTGTVTIPGSLQTVDGSAFKNCTGLTGVVLEEGVAEIGGSAFSGCTGITSVTLPEGLVSIGNNAFYQCTGLSGELTLPYSLQTIGTSAFQNCTGTFQLKLGAGLTSVGNSAFQGDSQMTGELTFPESMETIGANAFYGCSSVTRLTLPKHLQTLGSSAFNACSQMVCKNLTIPDGISTVSVSAFQNCNQLTGTLTIPDSVTEIGNNAFYATQFQSVVFGENVKTIGISVFQNNTSLTSINGLPDGLESLGANAFYLCRALAGEILLPAGLQSIGTNCFQGTQISKIEYHGGSITEIKNAFFSADLPALQTLDFSGSGIEKLAYSSTAPKLTEVKLPSTLKELTLTRKYALEDIDLTGCTGLTKVDLRNNAIDFSGGKPAAWLNSYTGTKTITGQNIFLYATQGAKTRSVSTNGTFTDDFTIKTKNGTDLSTPQAWSEFRSAHQANTDTTKNWVTANRLSTNFPIIRTPNYTTGVNTGTAGVQTITYSCGYSVVCPDLSDKLNYQVTLTVGEGGAYTPTDTDKLTVVQANGNGINATTGLAKTYMDVPFALNAKIGTNFVDLSKVTWTVYADNNSSKGSDTSDAVLKYNDQSGMFEITGAGTAWVTATYSDSQRGTPLTADVKVVVAPRAYSVNLKQAKSKVYGAADPVNFFYGLTVSANGKTEELKGVTFTRDAGEDVGTYQVYLYDPDELSLSTTTRNTADFWSAYAAAAKAKFAQDNPNFTLSFGANDTYLPSADSVGNFTITARALGQNVRLNVKNYDTTTDAQINTTTPVTNILPDDLDEGVSVQIDARFDSADVKRNDAGAVIPQDGEVTVTLTGARVKNYTLPSGFTSDQEKDGVIWTKSGEGDDTTITMKRDNLSAIINPLTVSCYVQPLDKVYDGTTTAGFESMESFQRAFTGLHEEDQKHIGSITAAFSDKNAGEDKTVTLSSEQINLDNYKLPAFTASITPRPLSVTGLTASDKAYDGTAEAEISGTPTIDMDGVLPGDTVSISTDGSELKGEFYDKNAGNKKSVVVSAGFGLTGADAENYYLQPAGTMYASITPITLTVTPDADQYKSLGTLDPSFTYTLSGLVPDDQNAKTGAALSGVVRGALSRLPGEEGGEYAFTLGSLTATSNYNLVLAEDAPKFAIRDTDATLKAISVSAGTLSPAFSPEVTEYTVKLPMGVTAVPAITAEAVNSAAHVQVTDADSLSGNTVITVTAADGMTVKTYTISFSVAEQVSVTAVVVNASSGGNDGMIIATGSGGSGSCEFNLDNSIWQSGSTFDGKAAGSYTLYVRDREDHSNTAQISVTVGTRSGEGTDVSAPTTLTADPASPVIPYSAGSLNVELTAGGVEGAVYRYCIYSGTGSINGNILTVTAPGAVTIRAEAIKDGSISTGNKSLTLNVGKASAVSMTAASQNVTTYGGKNGSITVTASGGLGTYQYRVGNGSWGTSRTFSGLAAGMYTVSVRDAADTANIISETITITQADATDAVAINAVLSTLTLGDTSAVTESLVLPASETYGGKTVSISWATSDSNIVSADGTVTRPSSSAGNKTVILTATVTCGGITRTKTFEVTVLAKATTPSGGGSGSSNTTTKTVTNADGSVTTTVTNKRTGTVTETTKYKDGSTLVVETKKDGTVTTTETRADGVRVKTVDAPEKDVTVSVTIPKSVGTTTILSRTEAGYGMVAVDAETGEVVKLSVPTEDGLLVKLDGSAELTLVNNAREFSDTNGHWAENAIDFATAHEMFAGTSETTFSPDDTMTRAMLMTVLARFDGEDTAGGSVWYEKGMAWAVANGVSDGSYPEDSISREQLVTMLWRYAGSPTVSGMALSEFSDHDSVSGYAADAMRWAVSEGLIVGVEHDVLAPRSTATRAQVATILMRFVEMLTK